MEVQAQVSKVMKTVEGFVFSANSGDIHAALARAGTLEYRFDNYIAK